jgi:hypothetical protein
MGFLSYSYAVAKKWLNTGCFFSGLPWIAQELSGDTLLNKLSSLISLDRQRDIAKGVALFGVFLAGYFVFSDEQKAREAAERLSPQALTDEVARLKRSLTELQALQADSASVLWSRPRDDQKENLKTGLMKLGHYTFSVEHGPNTDCAEFARDLRGIFHSAEWEAPDMRVMPKDYHPSQARGIQVYWKYQPEVGKVGPEVLDLFLDIFRQVGSGGAVLSADEPDVLILIGPKQSRQDLPANWHPNPPTRP